MKTRRGSSPNHKTSQLTRRETKKTLLSTRKSSPRNLPRSKLLVFSRKVLS
jgi:hypothetical protein